MSLQIPFFSIIIPTYNRASYLDKAIKSVRAQTFYDWECLIIDDGSSDMTEEVVKAEIANDKRFKYIYQDNSERSAARNRGIELSSGKYLCFLDSDDEYLPAHLESFLKVILQEGEKTAMYFCNQCIEYENGEISYYSNEQVITPDANFLLTNPISSIRVCIAKSILKKYRFPENISIGEDVLLWLLIWMEFPVIPVNFCTVKYKIHQGNSVQSETGAAEKMLMGLHWFFKQYPEIRIKINSNVLKNWYSKIYTNIAKYHLKKNKRGKAIQCLIKAIFLSPFAEQLKYRIRLLYLILFNKQIHINE